MKTRERIPQSGPSGWLVGIRATLLCAWCGRDVVDASGHRDVGSGRILLIAAPTVFRLAGGQPRCIVCGGPLLLEDWRSQAPTPDRSTLQPIVVDGASSEATAAA